MSILKKWLIENKYYEGPKKKIDTEEDTENINEDDKVSVKKSHVVFDGYLGGILYVPPDKEFEFIKRYAEDYKNGIKLYYVEQRPTVFKYMIDLDIADYHFWSDEEITSLCLYVNKIINEFYDGVACIVCKSSSAKIKKATSADSKDFIHTGVHMIWPKLYVNSDTAIYLRSSILQKMSSFKELVKPWTEIFDEVIYSRNGYRMVGSDKLTKKKIKGRTEFIEENRLYIPLVILDTEGPRIEYLKRLINDPISLISDTSIRYIPEAFRIANKMGMKPHHMPTWVNEDLVFLQKTKIPKRFLMTGTTEMDIISNIIRKNIPEYGRLRDIIKNIVRYPKDQNLLITTNSKFCLNIGREHNSCGIYFHCSPSGIAQKCLCACQNLNGRKNGLCKDYTSKKYPIPFDLLAVLFPPPEFRNTEVKVKTASKTEKTEKVKKVKETKTIVLSDNINSDNIEDGLDWKLDELEFRDITSVTLQSSVTIQEKVKKDIKPIEPTKKKKIQRPNTKGTYVPGMTTPKHLNNELEKSCGLLLLQLSKHK